MRVIDLESGETLQAANDEDLARVVLEHSDGELDEEAARKLVAERAYDADDA